jgi:hypothetical protein
MSELLHSILLPVRIPVIQVSLLAKVFLARADKVSVFLLECILLNTFWVGDRPANASQAFFLTSVKFTLKRHLINRQGRTSNSLPHAVDITVFRKMATAQVQKPEVDDTVRRIADNPAQHRQ